jgi:oxygen-independent coproporphyrinogen-3 oxidase
MTPVADDSLWEPQQGGVPSAAKSLYVHVPFCLSVCPYCDFVVYGGRAATDGELLDVFVDAVMAELRLRAATPGARHPDGLLTVYLGGGTPSLLGVHRIGRLLEGIGTWLGIAAGAEVSVEVNPGPRDRGELEGFMAAGVTRVSVGVQSLQPHELRRLGRRHGPNDVADAVRRARRAGARSVSLDLLYDIPGQSLDSWRATLDGVLALEPDHVSAYALTLDDPDGEGLTGPTGDHLPVRPGARRWRRRAAAEQDADRAAEMYRFAEERLERAGLRWYELSNWARPGHECRHNLAYWHREPYLALGPGAHGFDGQRRWWNAARLDAYVAALVPGGRARPALPPGGHEIVDGRTALFEEAMLGLRLAVGLTGSAARRIGGDARMADALEWGRRAGLLDGSRSTLSLRGRLVADELFARMA